MHLVFSIETKMHSFSQKQLDTLKELKKKAENEINELTKKLREGVIKKGMLFIHLVHIQRDFVEKFNRLLDPRQTKEFILEMTKYSKTRSFLDDYGRYRADRKQERLERELNSDK